MSSTNKRKIKTEKIAIESLEKQKIIKSNSAQNIKSSKNRKEEKQKELAKYSANKLKNLAKKTISKINISNKININKKKSNNEINITSYNHLDKNKKTSFLLNNKEQIKIMNDIKTFYNEKKEKSMQKSNENIINCNIINLNLEKNLIQVNRKESPIKKIDNKINNLNEVRMKVNPAFGRTTYSFYNKNQINGISFNDNNEFDKNTNFKDKLNIAFVSSIQQKINLNDKGIL